MTLYQEVKIYLSIKLLEILPDQGMHFEKLGTYFVFEICSLIHKVMTLGKHIDAYGCLT